MPEARGSFRPEPEGIGREPAEEGPSRREGRGQVGWEVDQTEAPHASGSVFFLAVRTALSF